MTPIQKVSNQINNKEALKKNNKTNRCNTRIYTRNKFMQFGI